MKNSSLIKKLRSTGDRQFSILIPTWNNLPFLKICIDSIRKNSSFNHQIIVHVNEGRDGTLEWLEAQEGIDYTYSSENIGVCYALNTSRTLAKTSYIVYLNDDMYVCPNWDSELLDEITAIGHNDFFLSSTAIEPVASSNCVIEKNFGKSVDDFREADLLNEFSSLKMYDWQGATWPPNIVHIDTWDLVGGYSIEFSPGMYSDPDFSMKLWLAGIRIFKGVSKSRAYHFGSKSTKRISKNKGYYRFIAKWGISSSTLTKNILHRGEPYQGPLSEPESSVKLKLKNFFKRFDLLFRKY